MPPQERNELQTLKELGLTEYEARVYLTSLTQGSVLLSELSFRSGVPRTKVYSTVRSLASKKLLRLSEHPMRCVAADVDEVFETTVKQEERRLRELKGNLSRLRKLRQQGLKGQSLAEGHYYIYVPQEAVSKLSELLSEVQYSFHAIVDSRGIEMLKTCGKQLLSASAGDTECKLLVSDRESDSVQELFGIPFKVRAGQVTEGRSLFIFDRTTVLISNSVTGNAMVISMADVAVLLEQNVFQPLWEQSVELGRFARLVNLGLSEELRLLKGDASIYRYLAKCLVTTKTESELRKLGVDLFRQLATNIPSHIFTLPPGAALPLWAELVDLSLEGQGSVRYDNVTKIMTIETGTKSPLPESIWLLAFIGYLEENGMPLRVINRVESERGTILQTKVTWNVLA